jgi:hypothetical protein
VGIGYALLWTSQSNYLTNVSTFYVQATHKDITITLTRFFGIFYMLYQSSLYLFLFIIFNLEFLFIVYSYDIGQIWGNLISYLVLQPTANIYGNDTTNNTTGKYNKCGADFSEQEYTSADATNAIDQNTV